MHKQEQCVYCKEWYPKPVSYHHSTEECRANEAALSNDKTGETPRTDAAAGDENERGQWENFQRGPYVLAGFARQIERELASSTASNAVAFDLKMTLRALLDRDITFDGRNAVLPFESHNQAINHINEARRKALRGYE